jgi:methyl-accepting chemotaxis protein
MVERLRGLLAALRAASEDLGAAAGILDRSTGEQSRLLEQQAAFLAELGATTRELEQTSSVASHQAESVLAIARDADGYRAAGAASAGESLERVQEMSRHLSEIVGRSAGLAEQARQAGEIVESVKDIAAQSHVLSLNASIEAARAGDAGRGFGVVAQEVRALAEQSAQSAARIGKIVQDIARAVGSTVTMIEEGGRGMESGMERIRASGESLREVGTFIGTAGEAALRIGEAVKQQTAGVAQIAAAMADVESRMQASLRGIQSVRDAAATLSTTSSSLRSVVEEFRS